MKKLFLILITAVLAVSCSNNLEDLNENVKDPALVSGESLFASSQKQLTDQLTTPNVNLNNLRLWTQQLQETTYLDESRYDQVTRSIPDNHWRVMYRDVLKDLDEASKIIRGTTYVSDELNGRKPNKLAIIEILTVYSYANLVETYGNIPYTEALDIDNLLPKYDDAKTVYEDLLVRLDAAINSMDTNLNSFDNGDDLIYGGNVGNWRKFANSLKLRMGLTIADVNPGLAQTTVTTAVNAGPNSGVFQSNADNATYAYRSAAPNNNPMNNNLVLSGRNDYVPAATIVNIMNDLNDPRRSAYFDKKVDFKYGWDPADPEVGNPVAAVSTSGTVTIITMTKDLTNPPAVGDEIFLQVFEDASILLGTAVNVTSNTIEVDNINTTVSVGDGIAINSFVGGLIGTKSTYGLYSHVSDRIVDPAEPGVIFSYAEVEFLLAEALERGIPVGGSAESHYKEGITANFNYWNVGDVASYLAKPEVDYNTAVGASSWKEVIGTQAYLALYNRSFAPYLSVRRLDYPILTKPLRAQSGFPVRYTYPVLEQTLNGANYGAASSAIGGDAAETKLFWDMFYTFDF